MRFRERAKELRELAQELEDFRTYALCSSCEAERFTFEAEFRRLPEGWGVDEDGRLLCSSCKED